MLQGKYEIFMIQSDDIIDNALRKIEANKYRTLVVTDQECRVLGTVTDGDIRKALIAKRSLLAPIYDVMNTNFYAVLAHQKNKAKDIFDAHFYINLIPVINEKGILLNILYRDKFSITDTVD